MSAPEIPSPSGRTEGRPRRVAILPAAIRPGGGVRDFWLTIGHPDTGEVLDL